MSKPQKDKSLTKDKLVGMKVIDAEGKLVGTVKDVSFTIGKSGISLSVEDADGGLSDIEWDTIQGAADFIVLKPAAAASQIASQPVQTRAGQQGRPVQMAQSNQAANQPVCQTCRGTLTYIPQYQRWYCYNCKKYA